MPCPNGTVSSYAGTSCDQPGVVYHFPELSKFFSSSGSVQITPDDVTILQDTNGPNTLLIKSKKFNVDTGQHVIVTLNFTVDSSSGTFGWLHNPVVAPDGDIQCNTNVNNGMVNVVSSPSVPQAQQAYTLGDYSAQVQIKIKGGSTGSNFDSYGIHFGDTVSIREAQEVKT